MQYKPVYKANGQLAAETIRLFLEANGIAVQTLQESAGAAYGFAFGPMGEVTILVPAEQLEEAEILLMGMESGVYIPDEDEGSPEADDFNSSKNDEID